MVHLGVLLSGWDPRKISIKFSKCFVSDSTLKKKYMLKKLKIKGGKNTRQEEIELKECWSNNYDIRQNRF